MKLIKLFIFTFVFVFSSCSNIQKVDKPVENQTQPILQDDTNQKKVSTKNNNKEFFENELALSMRVPKTLNPLLNQDDTVDNILKLIFEPLFILNDEFKPEPNLASNYDISEDGKTINIYMKDTIYWQNGDKITAKDVIFSLDFIKATNGDSKYYNVLDKIESYSNKGDRLVIKYKEPYSWALYNLCFPVISSSYYKNAMKQGDKTSFKPMGSGMYKFEAYKISSELDLIKSENFKGQPSIEKIKALVIPDRETELYALEENIINALRLSFSEWGKLNSNEEKLATNIMTNELEFLGFNFNKDIFKNPNFRKMVAYAINKNEIVQNIYLGNATKAITPINSYSWIVSENELQDYEYNLQKAIQSAIDSKINLNSLNLSILVNSESSERIEIANLISKVLNQIGIKATVLKKPFEEYKNLIETDNFDMFVGGIDFGLVPNFNSLLSSAGRGEGGLNYFNFSDSKMDTILNNLNSSASEKNFLKNSADFQQYFLNQIPMIPILFKNDILLTSSHIEGNKLPNIYSEFSGIEMWNIN